MVYFTFFFRYVNTFTWNDENIATQINILEESKYFWIDMYLPNDTLFAEID